MAEMARLLDGKLEHAPKSGVFNGNQVSNPSEEMLLNAGYKYIISSPPPTPQKGGRWQEVWFQRGNEIVVTDWEWIEIPVPLEEKVEALAVLALRDSGLDIDLGGSQVVDAISTLAWDKFDGAIPDGGDWKPGLRVISGQSVKYGGGEYEVTQGHITQADWPPDKIPALFKAKVLVGEPWKQPAGAHDAYKVGDAVTYDGKLWESTVNANVYPPGTVIGQWIEIN